MGCGPFRAGGLAFHLSQVEAVSPCAQSPADSECYADFGGLCPLPGQLLGTKNHLILGLFYFCSFLSLLESSLSALSLTSPSLSVCPLPHLSLPLFLSHTHTIFLPFHYLHRSPSLFPLYSKIIRKIPMLFKHKELMSCDLWDSINLKEKSKVFQGQLPLFID